MTRALHRPIAFALVVFLVSTASAQEIIRLWPDGPPVSNELTGPETGDRCVGNISDPTLTLYRPDPSVSNGAAVMIVPGGGYSVVCHNPEGRAVAIWLNSLGYTAGVLKYRLPNRHSDVPIQDAQQGLRIMRSMADELGIRSDRIGALGFSAGGHLTSTLATHFDHDHSGGRGGHLDVSHRPDFVVLVYPVITMDPTFTHGGSRNNLIGDAPNAEMEAHFSNEQQISDDTPPTILIHSSDDTAVPVRNSLEFYSSLVAHGVSAEMHVFERGGHGYGVNPESPSHDWTKVVAWWLETHNAVE